MAKNDASTPSTTGGFAPRLRRSATTLVVLSAFVPTAVLLGGRAAADAELANQQSFGDVSSENATQDTPGEVGVAPDPLPDGVAQPDMSEPSGGDAAAHDVSPGVAPPGIATGSAESHDASPDDAPPQELLTGSASGEDAASGDPPSSPVESTGSAVLDSASTGSAFDENSLSLEPPPALGGILQTGSAGNITHEQELDPTPVADANAASPVVFGLESGSVATACSGSALSGGFGLLAGSAAGSGFIGPGSFAPPWWIPIGSAGSLWLPPGFGSSGSALGSAVVGSAVTGSALMTCMLTVVPSLPPPVPPFPPLLLFPPLPGGAIPGGVVTVSAPAAGAAQGSAAAAPFVPHFPVATGAAGSAVDPAGWNTIEIMTLLILVILMGYGTSSTAAARKPPL
ncbi:hypothetical protein [Nocardia altamirensis]|uniref:hypothetical protein n=1 Tax=Nocardia altamirensis TaxID=472158 RepID=UPI00114D1BE4|nr:hypothetical protein [Nocardia altamirensis]